MHRLIRTRTIRTGEGYRPPIDSVVRRGACETEDRGSEVGHGVYVGGVGRVGGDTGATYEQGNQDICDATRYLARTIRYEKGKRNLTFFEWERFAWLTAVRTKGVSVVSHAAMRETLEMWRAKRKKVQRTK